MVQYGCKAASDLVQLLQISKAGDGLAGIGLLYKTIRRTSVQQYTIRLRG